MRVNSAAMEANHGATEHEHVFAESSGMRRFPLYSAVVILSLEGVSPPAKVQKPTAWSGLSGSSVCLVCLIEQVQTR